MKAPWVVLDTNTGEMACLRCGERLPMPLGLLRWVVAVVRAFERAHAHCREGMEPREEPLCRLARS